MSSIQVLATKKNIALVCDCEMGSELRLAGDEYRLKQVLINLINNAIKFTELGKDLDEYKSIGMNDHIVKPFSEEKLFEKIQKNLVSVAEMEV